MLTKTRGIVFRKIPYSETSIISDIYTEQHGLMSYIIGGVRKARPTTSASLLQVMSIVEILAYHSNSNKLHRIKEIKPAYVYKSMPMDVRKNAILMFLAELCSRSIRETEENPALFEMITNELVRLDKATGGFNDLHLEFMIKLADQLGFGPGTELFGQHTGIRYDRGRICRRTTFKPHALHRQWGRYGITDRTGEEWRKTC